MSVVTGVMLDLSLDVFLRLPPMWAAAVASLGTFKAYVGPRYTDELVTAWRATLAPNGDAKHVLFRQQWDPRLPERCRVVVRLGDEPASFDVLGGGRQANGTRIMPGKQSLSLMVYAPDSLLVGVLWNVVKGCMAQLTPVLAASGYLTIGYDGGGDVDPQEALLPDGIFARQLRYSSDVLPIAPSIEGEDGAAKSLVVATTDITIDGHTGGIEPVAGA